MKDQFTLYLTSSDNFMNTKELVRFGWNQSHENKNIFNPNLIIILNNNNNKSNINNNYYINVNKNKNILILIIRTKF